MSYAMVGVLMIGGMSLYALIGVLAGRRFLHGKVVEGHNDVCVPIFLNAGVIFAVLLGFFVIAVWESYDAAKTNAATEAANLIPLYRTTNALPKEAGDKMREITREYAESVIKTEWVTQATTGKASSESRKASGDMFRAFGAEGAINAQIKKDYPFICTALMTAIKDVSAARNKRNIQANEEPASVMWLAAIGGALIVISMSFVIFMERPVPHILLATLMAGLIGSLLFCCYILAHPFKGPLAITPEAFENALVTMDDVDRGN